MPRVKVFYPSDAFSGEETAAVFFANIRSVVASCLSGPKNNGDMMSLQASDVGVIPIAYNPRIAWPTALFSMDIEGVPFDQRMVTITHRLGKIKAGTRSNIRAFCKDRYPIDADGKPTTGQDLVEALFHPVGEECWVSE